MKLNLLFIVMDALTILAYPLIFLYGKLHQFLKSRARDVIIPLSAMTGDTSEDTVFLKLDKQQVESLPTFPVHRRWS